MTKLFTLAFLLQCLSMSLLIANDGNAQVKNIEEVKVHLTLTDVKVEMAFKELEKKTEYKFVFATREIKDLPAITFESRGKSVYELLLDIAAQTQLSFKQVDFNIHVKKSGKNHQVTVEEMVDVTVTGKVSDDKGESLPGATITVLGNTTGTITDIDGNYSITVPDGSVLVFSFIGYEPMQVSVDNQSQIDVTLQADISSLEEVVVIGYGEQKKVTFTGSVASVSGEAIRQSPVTNVSNSLVGRLPGLSSVTRSGEPGNDNSIIRIRGTNTLGNSGALVVVDGIPGRDLNRIDPNSIETITVLKDASAAIYGAQAANGVILITTKRGSSGKTKIEINMNQGFNSPTRIPEMANSEQYLTMLNEIEMYQGRPQRFSDQEIMNYREGSDPWRYPDTDWFNEVLKPWSSQTYNTLTVSGGNENFNHFLMLGAKSQDGYYKNSATKYGQYDFRSNLDGKINENVRIGFDLAGRQENRNFPTRSAGNIFRAIMRGKPNMHAFWPDGNPGPDIEYGDNPAVVATEQTGYDRDKVYNLQGTLRLNINIPWIKGLSLNSNAGLDQTFRVNKRFETPWFLYNWDGNSLNPDGTPQLLRGQRGFSDPRLTENMESHRQILLNSLLQYDKVVGENHFIKLMVGTESRVGRGNTLNAFRRYFVSTAVDQMFAGGNEERDNGGSAYKNARFSYIGRVNYEYAGKYLAEFVWRYDGSYIFPEGKRFGFFPGISAGWRISEEKFWQNNIPSVDHFKIRGSYGQTGNDRIDEWQFLASYGFGDLPAIFGGDQEHQVLRELRIPNPNVTWEVADQYNLGIELGFFNSRLTVEADVFYNYRSQILWWRNASIPNSTGLSLPRENIGEVSNKGYEFIVGYNGDAGALKYQISANGGYARNKVEFWDESPGAPEYQQTTGRPIPSNPFAPNNDLYYQSIGVFRDQSQIDAMPHWPNARPGDLIFADVNGDGVIDANDQVRNDRNNIPRFTGGMSLNLQYKGFDFAVLIQGASGAVRYIQTESGEIGNYLKDFADNRWTVENGNSNYPRTFNRTDEYWINQRNTFWLRNTDYIRLKSLEVGYSLSPSLTQRFGIEKLRFFVSGFNLLTYSPDLKDFDPESDNASGQSYPLQRVINSGLTLTF